MKVVSVLSVRTLLSIAVTGAAFLFPLFSFAEHIATTGNKSTVQGYIILIGEFFSSTIIPLIFAIALLFFLVNVGRFFILGGADASEQEKAKRFALYGIGAFVFLVSIWGIVNLMVNGLGFDDNETMCPDYLASWCDTHTNGAEGSAFERTADPYRATQQDSFYDDTRDGFSAPNRPASPSDFIITPPITNDPAEINFNQLHQQRPDEANI